MTQQKPQVNEARRAPRLKVFQPAGLIANDIEHRAHILDLSATGARIHSRSPTIAGSSVSLVAGGTHIHSHVVWERGGRAGLAFARPLSPAEVEAIGGLRMIVPA